jgi:hypothetical protein
MSNVINVLRGDRKRGSFGRAAQTRATARSGGVQRSVSENILGFAWPNLEGTTTPQFVVSSGSRSSGSARRKNASASSFPKLRTWVRFPSPAPNLLMIRLPLPVETTEKRLWNAWFCSKDVLKRAEVFQDRTSAHSLRSIVDPTASSIRGPGSHNACISFQPTAGCGRVMAKVSFRTDS